MGETNLLYNKSDLVKYITKILGQKFMKVANINSLNPKVQ